MNPIRVAFIGAGSMANSVHYPSVADFAGAELVAICDLDEARLGRTADRYGVTARYREYHRMLEHEAIDAVYVIMPAAPLSPIVLDCLAAGKHVFTEKPPGVRTGETQAWAEAAARQGVKTCVGFNRRYSAVFMAARAAVLEDDTSPPSMALAEFHKDMLQSGPYWDMSILRTDVIHVVDALRDLCGEVAEVTTHTDRHYRREGWENSCNLYNALLRFENGASGILTANRTAGNRYERFEFHGRAVSTYTRAPDRTEIWRAGEGETVLTGEQLTGSREPRITYGYWEETRHFLECVAGSGLPRTHFGDAVRTMELVDRIESGSRR
jgi:predicted dehydrogenase